LRCLDDFIAAEAEAGRTVDPSVLTLRARIAGEGE
jgi:hypothetical protein